MNENHKVKNIVIIGGGAGGASCAARARRLSEQSEIIVLEQGEFVSFANCGLPYYVGGIIPQERALIMATPRHFRDRFNVDVRISQTVTNIDRANREIEVRDEKTHVTGRMKYDALVVATGASPVRPPLPGIDLPGIFSLRTIPDSREIIDWISRRKSKTAVVVGGGFIGLEMAENLLAKGLSVTVVEMMDHVMPALDREMVTSIHKRFAEAGVALNLGDAVAGFRQAGAGLEVTTKSGKMLPADLVILALGVRPDVALARAAGLETGSRGGIRVDEKMRTADEHIWAVGDAVEVKDFVTGEWVYVPLAGPASRQGRTAADAILGRDMRFRGVQATAICGIFGMAVASTGVTENTLVRLKAGGKEIPYEKIYLYSSHHVGYYPGAAELTIKLIFSTVDGKVLGAQAVGFEGVDKRIDVIAEAIQKGATVYDLEESELGYSPQFGATRDPVNIAGMIAANALRGDTPLAHWEGLSTTKAFILDVRSVHEFFSGHAPGAVNIPVNELRGRIDEIPAGKELWVYCGTGHRSHVAVRLLRQHGFDAKNISGGIANYLDFGLPLTY